MNRLTNHRTFMESAHAYTRSRQPTSQLTANLCAAFAQMVADDWNGPVAVALPVGVRVVREPTPKVAKMSA